MVETGTSGAEEIFVIFSPIQTTAKTRKPSGLSTAVNPYLAASAAASEHIIAFPNCQKQRRHH